MNKLLSLDKNVKCLWILFFITFIPIFLVFTYDDFLSIIHFEINAVGAVVKSNFFHMYDYINMMADHYKASGIPGVAHAEYNALFYVILGVWGIPLYLWEVLTGQLVTNSVGALMYGKSIYIVALIIDAWIIYKILILLDVEQKKRVLICFSFCTSIFVYSAIGVIGQADIIAMVFSISGIYMLLKNKYWQFIVFFMIAITCKVFAVFIFIPLIMISNKKIHSIIVQVALGLLPSVAVSLLFAGEGAKEMSHFTVNMLFLVLDRHLPLLDGDVSATIVLLGIFYFYCFLINPQNETERKKYIILYPFITYGLLFASFKAYPYWLIRLVPWMLIAIFVYSNNSRLSLLMETIGGAALTCVHFYNFYWCFDLQNLKYSFLKGLYASIDETNLISLKYIVDNVPGYTHLLSSIAEGIFVVCLFVIIYFCLPYSDRFRNEEPILIRHLVLRVVINVLVICIPIGLFFYNCYC